MRSKGTWRRVSSRLGVAVERRRTSSGRRAPPRGSTTWRWCSGCSRLRDGDGKTSLFTRTGKVVNGQLVLSPQIFVSEELE
jgi:hypothetical protein